ncbi:MAG: hypothetical protein CL841_04850 [Crocinitomicaceae bacterium]|nr:hypothetical protein [Crocinitomicaceae bacterium]
MKSTLTQVLVFLTIFPFAQNVPIDFELGGNGLNWTWTTFENDTNPPLEIVENPDPSGINASPRVAKFTALQLGQPWAGCESMHGSDIGSFSFNNSNCTVSIMIWKSVISDVGIKFVDATNAAQPEIKIANTLVNQWEEIIFDFSSRIGVYPITKDQIVIFPDFDLGGRTQDNVIYFDNVYGTSTSTEDGDDYKSELIVSPNPVKDLLNISVTNFSGDLDIQIFDLAGILVASSKKNKINIESFAKGIYLVKVVYGKITNVVKIIKA